MAGFVVFYETGTSPEERENDFQSLLESTAKFKGFPLPTERADGRGCTAAKLHAASSLHHGIVRDEQSGSWLIAAGMVVVLEGNNDPSVLLEDLLVDYLEKGANALERIDGHFALAIYNGIENNLAIISDPMGVFAIYYARRGKRVLISSSALAIAKQIGSKADSLMIESFLRAGRLHGEKTLWQDVKRVRPATMIRISSEKFEEREYWTLKVDENIACLSMTSAVDLADEKISHIIKLALTREGKVWADLTGGFDTRLTTLYLNKVGIPFTSYCIGPEGHPDVEISKQIGKDMGWEYRHMPLPEGWADEQISWFDAALGKGDGNLIIPQLVGVLRGAQERSSMSFVSVTGIGADEWRWHALDGYILIPGAISRLNYDYLVDANIIDGIPSKVMRQERAGEVRNELKEYLSGLVARYSDSAKVTQMDIAWIRHRHPIHLGTFTSALAGCMRSLTPFCFKDLVNYGLSINHQWRINFDFRFVRTLMERQNPRLANIRTVLGAPAVPIRLNNLNKFMPLWAYLGDLALGKASKKLLGRKLSVRAPRQYPTYPLPTWKAAWLRWAVAEHLLTPEKMRSGALYNAPELGKLLTEGLSGNNPYSEFLDRVITVEKALRATGAEVEQAW